MAVSTKENGMNKRNAKKVKVFNSSLMEKFMKGSGMTTREKEKVAGYVKKHSTTLVSLKTI